MNRNPEDQYKGNIADKTDERDGWFVGHFMNGAEGEPGETDYFEIKSWVFPSKKDFEEKGHRRKKSRRPVWEFTLVLEGEGMAEVEHNEFPMVKWDYMLIPPELWNNFPKAITKFPLRGITIKAPSYKCSKVEEGQDENHCQKET